MAIRVRQPCVVNPSGGLYLRMLGGLELEHGRLSRPKPLLLLAYLSLEGSKERHHLCDLFYVHTADPRASLRVAMRHIREASEGVLTTRGTSVASNADSDARDLLAAAERRDDDRVIDLYRGPFLHGVSLEGVPFELEEWMLGTRERLADTARQSMLRKAEALAARGDVAGAARWAERACQRTEAPPLDYGQLAPIHRMLAAGGSTHAPRLRAEMEELGIPVETEFPHAERMGAFASRAANAGNPGPGPTPRHNLPPPTTSFVGREQELVSLTEVLEDPHRRLVTLLGPGGIGKTRLAVELARIQCGSGRWDGVTFVPLDDVRSAADVTLRISRALAVPPSGVGDEVQALVDVVGRQTLLLILDNYRLRACGTDVVAALLQGCPAVSLLVTSRERLRLAAESVYHLEGLPVPAASRRPSEDPRSLASPSMELFVHRARSADLRFKPTNEQLEDVREICRLVEGAPLGIELAAAWVRALPVEDIRERLAANLDSLASPDRARPDRHRSLRAAFESSWNYLDPREQAVFAHLSVFRDGFRREDAAAVADASIPVLAALIDSSLLRVSPSGRYDRHALLLHFASEKLAERPAERGTYEARHAHHFLRMAEELEPKLRSPEQAEWLDRLEAEMGNFRAALAWALRMDDAGVALRLAGALGLYWYVRSAFVEGRRWLDAALALPWEEHDGLRSKALHAAGRLARSQGDFAQARDQLHEALARSRKEGHRRRVVECLNELAITAAATAEYDTAIAHFERGKDMATSLGDVDSLIKLVNNLGLLYAIVGRLDEAEPLARRGLDIARSHGDRRNIAHAHANLAQIALRRGRYERALAGYDESIAIASELQDSYLIAEAHLGKATASSLDGAYEDTRSFLYMCLELFHEQHDRLGVIDSLGEVASLAVSTGNPKLAARMWGALDQLRDRLGFPMQPFARQRYERDRRNAAEALSETETEALRSEGAGWVLAQAVDAARAWLHDSETRSRMPPSGDR